MQIIETIDEIKTTIKRWKRAGISIGLVPTMGYLHEGHKSLIDRAVAENDRVVVSIFVNPTQFAPEEDLEDYPRDLIRDEALCETCGVNLIFYPRPEEMYATDATTSVTMAKLSGCLCGKSRPTHFSGVCTVVSKLFNIVAPNRAYFGQKDAQQLAIIRRMVRDLNYDVEIVACPIIREPDGLAMSSRNLYLSKKERQAACILSKAVALGQQLIGKRTERAKVLDAEEMDAEVLDLIEVIGKMKDLIHTEPLARIDYVEAVDAVSLEPATKLEGNILVAIAVYIGKTRLIDNFIVDVGKQEFDSRN